MSRIGLIFVSVLASCKSGDKSATSTTGSADLAPRRAPIAAPTAPTVEVPRPSLPDTPTGDAAPQTLDEQFADEPVDNAWKAKTEAALGKRLASVPHIKHVDCHQTQCRLVIGGTEHDVGKAIDALESDHALHELARNVILTAPTKRDDGTIELHAFAQITRSD
jgi:hypothetical protein